MHCLGAGTGAQSNSSSSGSPVISNGSASNGIGIGAGVNGSSGSSDNAASSSSSSNDSSDAVPGSSTGTGESIVLGVVRALGILVCEGRIQGPPRGYKEGPHCAAPFSLATNHQCEKDNYLCDRYLVLVREIRTVVDSGLYLCLEVVLCSDCECGLLKSKCKRCLNSNFVATVPWHTSEMLLEYWCIGIVQNKNPETMMNSQGLYQAVRSRLHFSQVAAWWSRTQGKRPSYIATRLAPNNHLKCGDEHLKNLKRFREKPVEHNFPLANLGDGHFIQVTMWALPRMEDIPCLQCPLHHKLPQDEPKTIVDGCPLVSTSSKNLIPTSNNDNTGIPTTIPELVNDPPSNLQIPALLDDKLRIDCVKLGKHHCQCADDEEDVHEIPTSPAAAAAAAALVRPNGERKRRRSLPCRPSEPTTTVASGSGSNSPVLPKLQESVTNTSGSVAGSAPAETTSSLEGLERSFRTQLSIEDQQECDGNQEKRYKRSESTQQQQQEKLKQGPETNTNVPLLIPWLSYSSNGHAQASSLPTNSLTKADVNLVINPFYSYQNFPVVGKKVRGRSAEPELSTNGFQQQQQQQWQLDERNKVNSKAGSKIDGEDLNRLMSKLSFTQDKESSAGSSKIDQSRLLDWISRVPGRVRSKDGFSIINNNNNNNNNNYDELVDVKTFTNTVAQMSGGSTTSTQVECDVKALNRHLKLSAKEFDEVIAVLKARTPMGRKRPGVRTAKRKERYDRLVNEVQVQQLQTSNLKTLANESKSEDGSLHCNKADIFMGAILRSSSKETTSDRIGLADISNGTRTSVSRVKESARVAEKITSSTKTTAPPTNGDYSSERGSKNKTLASDCDESSFPLAINKRIMRIKQIFKRDQDKSTLSENDINCSQSPFKKHESRAKRRIDFTSRDLGDGEKDDKDTETHCDSSSGTGRNNAHVRTTLHSKNSDFINSCNPSESNKLHTEYIAEKSKRKSKHRGNCDLSPIRVNHEIFNDEKVERNETDWTSSDSDGSDKSIVPSAKDQERFRRSLENAASMVFHSRTGLPLTSSPAPLRRGHCCFDFDSSLNSVSSKRSALFELNTPPSPGAVSLEETDREIENVCDIEEVTRRRSNSRNRPQSHALLGSFEESALNGRLEPVSTVHGFTAEIGASGAFCPKHRKLPVTVFFYTLGDNDKVSSPYLAHINLGKKGYQVPRSGTIQVTLLNPLGTVVKMFVVLYDLTDMPLKSHTFLRQRTLRDKTLRYLIHLRFMSGKSGRIYLHTDVRMIICRKADVDTASDFGSEPPKELRSYIHGPTNPKFSPRC